MGKVLASAAMVLRGMTIVGSENSILTPQRQLEDADAAQRSNRLAAHPKLDDSPVMTDLSFPISESMLRWLEQQATHGDYVDVGDLLRDLIRREQRAEAEDAAWVREKIAEGEASGYLEEDAREVLKGIRAKLRDA